MTLVAGLLCAWDQRFAWHNAAPFVLTELGQS